MARAVRDRQQPLVRRAVGIAVALLLVTCTLIAQWHEVMVVHVRCAAHGELIHVTSGDDGGLSTASIPTHGEHRLAPHSGDSTSDHDHCLLSTIHGTIATRGTSVTITDVAALVVIGSLPPSEPSARATFRLAPKTSPPV